MIMEIRVVVEVPKDDEEKRQEVIDGILDVVREKLPNLRKAARHSPVTVTIRDLDESIP